MKLKSNKTRTLLLLSIQKELAHLKKNNITKINSLSIKDHIEKYDSIEISLINEIETYTKHFNMKTSGQTRVKVKMLRNSMDFIEENFSIPNNGRDILDFKRTICSYKKLFQTNEQSNCQIVNTPLSIYHTYSTRGNLSMSKKEKAKESFNYLKNLSKNFIIRIRRQKGKSFHSYRSECSKEMEGKLKNETKTEKQRKNSLFANNTNLNMNMNSFLSSQRSYSKIEFDNGKYGEVGKKTKKIIKLSKFHL